MFEIQRIKSYLAAIPLICSLANGDWQKPVLDSPPDEAILHISIPHLSWHSMAEVSPDEMFSYRVQISPDADFQTIVDEDRIPAVITRYVPDRELPEGLYYWRVASNKKPKAWSKSRSFVIRPPATVLRVGLEHSFDDIRRTIGQANAQAPARVEFQPGDYRLAPNYGDSFIELTDVDDLVIDGRDSRITFSTFITFIRLIRCRRVMVKNFTFDFDPPPYTAGYVRKIDKDTGAFDVEIAEDHPLPESNPAFYRDTKGLVMDPQKYRMKSDVSLVLAHKGWEKIGPRIYRLEPERKNLLGQLERGDVYVLDPRQVPPFRNHYTDRTVFYRITVHAAANECFNSHYANRHSIIRCRIERKPGRFIAANNGGHNHHNARVGPWIESCLFENTADDICHVNTLTLGIKAVKAPDLISLNLGNPHDYGAPVALDTQPGDLLQFFNRAKGLVLGERRVARTRKTEGTLEIELESSVANLVPGRFTTSKSGSRRVPDSLSVTQVFNLSRACNQFVFRNNTVSSGRRVGVLAKGVGGLIENNDFEGLGGGAVEFWNAPFEGPGARDYVVSNNRIKDCCLIDRHDAPIWIQAFTSGSSRIHSNILITGNQISGIKDCAMRINDARNVLIRDNTVIASQSQTDEKLIISSNTKDLITRDNRIAPE